jgi:hypothetical protein
VVLSRAHGILPLLYAIPLLGLLLVPFALVPGRSLVRRMSLASAVGMRAMAAVIGLIAVFAITLQVAHWSAFPGNIFTSTGFAPGLHGDKPPLMPPLLFMGIEALALVSFATIAWSVTTRVKLLPPVPSFALVALAGSQLLPLLVLQANFYDRYYLPVALLCCPILAALATHAPWQAVARAWAIAATAGGIILYVAGEQDYQAWQLARDLAAHQAYSRLSPLEVDAGYEANAVYGFLPAVERDGYSQRLWDYLTHGPQQPRLILRFAGKGDPRPGIPYRSVAPGKVVSVSPRE